MKVIDADTHIKTLFAVKRFTLNQLVLIQPEKAGFHRAAVMCERWQMGLRAGDALHLAIAERHGMAVCTLDKIMKESALTLGLSPVDGTGSQHSHLRRVPRPFSANKLSVHGHGEQCGCERRHVATLILWIIHFSFGSFIIGNHLTARSMNGLMRSALVWLDCADPCLTRTRLEVNDPDTAKLAALLRVCHGILGSQSYTVSEAVEFSSKQGNEDLKAAFLEVAAVKGKPNEVDTVRLGNWIKHYKERIFKGYRFEK